jgi:branched-subunit amino acid ABC-type transport system permease component
MIQTLFNGVVSGTLVALPALALALSFSVLRFANFAIGAMVTLGAYLIYYFNVALSWPLYGAAIAGALLGGVVAVAVDWLVYRPLRERSSVTLLVASMGVALMLENGVRLVAGSTPLGYDVEPSRPLRISALGGLRVNVEQLLILLVGVSALLAVWALFRFTPAGRAMRAVADNPSLAAVRGISRARVVALVWLMSGVLASAAGLLIGLDQTLDPQMGWNYLLPVFAAAILGGIDKPQAAVAGALVMGVLSELSTLVIAPHYRTVVAFIVLAVLLMKRPWGLFGQMRVAR